VNKIARSAFIVFGLLGAAAIVLILLFGEVLNCYVVRWSDFEEISPNLFVSPEMPADRRQKLLTLHADAQKRLGRLYPAMISAPVIIAGYTDNSVSRYGMGTGGTGRAYCTPIETFIVLGPNGLNVDVMAHEMAHAELAARLGGNWALARANVPVWFDEGLALQVDDRPKYNEDAWQRLTGNGRTEPSLAEIADRPGFSTGNVTINYATSKREVTRWLTAVGRAGFSDLLTQLAQGIDFTDAYANVEKSLN
jgi:hypothetical protein